MYAKTTTTGEVTVEKQFNTPTTPRGRALYTVDWFLNGKPVLRNHDNPQLSIINGCHC